MTCTDPDCKARFLALLTDYENLQVDNAAKLRQINRLKKENERGREEQPEHTAALELFDFWVERCGKDPKRTKFGEKREKAVLARLKQGYTKRQIGEAIMGAALAAFRDPGTGVVYDDLELVCRNEVQLEKFIARYEAHQERQQVAA